MSYPSAHVDRLATRLRQLVTGTCGFRTILAGLSVPLWKPKSRVGLPMHPKSPTSASSRLSPRGLRGPGTDSWDTKVVGAPRERRTLTASADTVIRAVVSRKRRRSSFAHDVPPGACSTVRRQRCRTTQSVMRVMSLDRPAVSKTRSLCSRKHVAEVIELIDSGVVAGNNTDLAIAANRSCIVNAVLDPGPAVD